MASKGTEVVTLAPGDERLLVRSAKIEVIAGPDRGLSAALRAGALVVGSGAGSDLLLSDRSVSSRHLEIQAAGDGYLLRDLGSTNGTAIGDLKVQAATVAGPVEIALGRTRLRFTPGSEQESFPLSPRESFGSLLGKSPSMRRCFALLERAAQTDSSVLLEGESGTGKEVAAESVHQASPRAGGPFVVVDCGAIAPNLVESELFGHEKGAFTGAVGTRVGAFEQADGGTLFLDEIGELPLEMQPKLLRFLEKREVRRVGGSSARSVNVRVVAATLRRLEERVSEGAFRQDLFFRLAVLRVELPPLRRRREDVPLLALALARKLRKDVDPAAWLPEKTLQVLQSYDWPGNVRELRNVIERLAAVPELGPQALLGAGGAPSGGDSEARRAAAPALPRREGAPSGELRAALPRGNARA
ncbi:MAG: sigma 54-interacting transcriptional regulator [Myxococcales bacterium]